MRQIRGSATYRAIEEHFLNALGRRRPRPSRPGRPHRVVRLVRVAHATHRIRTLGATAHPTASWVIPTARNLVIDLEDTGSHVRYLIRDRDGTYPALLDIILADTGIQVVRTGVQVPRMNALMQQWVRTCRRELLDRTLLCNQRHLLHALHEYEIFYNAHRAHQGIANARPLAALPEPITRSGPPRSPEHPSSRLAGLLHEYEHAA